MISKSSVSSTTGSVATNLKYIPVIGLEIHAELKTASKMFCPCKNDPDEEIPNANICPICMGHPGTLPVLNKDAIQHVLRIGMAVQGDLADFTEWDRKNYFYPDIPKGYQISQYKYPLVSNGSLHGVALERIHLEEDTARSTHDQHEKSLVDFNRSGVPLMELVTKPVIHDAETAVAFAKELQLLLRTLGAGDANLEKGEMRVEANVSVARISDKGDFEVPRSKNPASAKASAGKQDPNKSEEINKKYTLGTKTEVKNLNSFRSVERAIAYEIDRQIKALESGEKIIQETRGWDDSRNETYSQRSKESSHDYRYFPDPDIPKMKISEIPEFSSASLSKSLPELPWTKRERFIKDFGMTEKEVAVFVESPALSKYFESIISNYATDAKRVKLTVNYLLSDFMSLLKIRRVEHEEQRIIKSDRVKAGMQPDSFEPSTESLESIIPPESFAELITMAASNELSSRGAKDLLPILTKEKNSSAKELAKKHNLIQKSDAADIEPAIEKVIADNQKVAAEYKAGKTASLQFLIGMAMKATKGGANPAVIKELLLKKLG